MNDPLGRRGRAPRGARQDRTDERQDFVELFKIMAGCR